MQTSVPVHFWIRDKISKGPRNGGECGVHYSQCGIACYGILGVQDHDKIHVIFTVTDVQGLFKRIVKRSKTFGAGTDCCPNGENRKCFFQCVFKLRELWRTAEPVNELQDLFAFLGIQVGESQVVKFPFQREDIELGSYWSIDLNGFMGDALALGFGQIV